VAEAGHRTGRVHMVVGKMVGTEMRDGRDDMRKCELCVPLNVEAGLVVNLSIAELFVAVGLALLMFGFARALVDHSLGYSGEVDRSFRDVNFGSRTQFRGMLEGRTVELLGVA